VHAGTKFGSYIVFEELGKGGMATVHRAELVGKKGQRTQVALKRLLPAVAKNRELVTQFAREARLLKYLEHPNIPHTYEHGKVMGDSYFIAMEYVPGPTLKQLVQQCTNTVGDVPFEVTLSVAAQVCDALDHAHTRCDEKGKPLGIIHRDICPANVILSEEGVAKVIDFGLAKANVRTHESTKGIIKGKYSYVAPEYLDGALDTRADLWAVGVVMYELLTARRLFDAHDDFETMTRVRKLPIPRPSRANPRVSPHLDEIVMTTLERDPRRRWQTAAMLRDALRGVIAQPGNFIDQTQISDWMRWVFSDTARTERADPSQVTAPEPAVPTPITQEKSSGIVGNIARGARRLLGKRTK
jgi:serine/threonine-protein kinase